MHLKSLVVGAALLSNFALLTYGRAVDLPKSDVSTTDLSNAVVLAHELEPRAFKSIRKKYDDWKEERKASKDKKKEKEDGKTGSGSAAVPEEFELMSPPAKYTGPVPRGMEQDPELSVWNRFLDLEVETGINPPKKGGYLMYSGADVSKLHTRTDFKASAAEDENIGILNDWDDTYGLRPANTVWNDYVQANPEKKSVVNFAVSWAQARRASQANPELHMLYGSRDEPLMRDRSYFGAVEAGIITGPDSKVNKIWRYNREDVVKGQSLPVPTLAWDRSLHAPFGKSISDLDWRVDPKGEGQPEGTLPAALPK
ncbi:hypothetical protein HBI56_105490 [Parastagonospora nodorum]|nr:hypothetical protein HBI10_164330 [Parastagonospora nodorum]KAH4021652.1 hypothetical protein HBI13_105560 [Parastagonospora nodorum]KAH4030401.1 hypothetical protein HBI09_129050 [Parastagonospora nodorum]KAH4048357.1 hypothetical protein HBH49_157590 [Parastagonospora nodorum]KAH4105214.1 hypothetical protein HBH46_088420 [Parastagonospora nodorum]